MSRLSGKVAVVTGASKGIGAGIAKVLGAEGASVVVNYASDKDGAIKVIHAIEQAGGKAIAVQGDVSKADDVRRILRETKSVFGTLNILVNNAAVFAFAPLEASTEEEFHREFNINVLGTMLTIREAVNYFGPDGGSIINLTSVVSKAAMPNTVIYSATKGAVDTLTNVLAAELAPKKIRVNAVAPGMTLTEGAEAVFGSLGVDMNAAAAGIPLGRLGLPEDIAKVVLFLASDDSAWITGDRITASGGQK